MRRRRIQKKRRNDGPSIGTIIVLLLLVAAFVYVFQALGVYDMLLNPSPGPIDTTGAQPTPGVADTETAAVTSSAEASPSPGAASGQISGEIKMGAITLYGVQLGVFSKEENATATADEFKKQGAAGYILKENAMFRVLDSVYYNQNDAKAVRDAYKKNNATDAYLLNVQVNGINWKVNASQGQIDAIKSAVGVLQKEIVSLIDVQKRFAQQQSDLSACQSAIKLSAQNLSGAGSALNKAVGSTSSSVIKNLGTCLEDSAQSLNKLVESNPTDAVAFGSGLKYNIIDILLQLQKKVIEAQ